MTSPDYRPPDGKARPRPKPSPPECCGEPMYLNPDPRTKAGGVWVCRARKREQNRRYYDEQSGVRYNALLLRHRRTKAMTRRAAREASRG